MYERPLAAIQSNQFSGGNSEWVPPDPISNSEVKTLSADGSVGSPHVRVGHRQDLFVKGRTPKGCGLFLWVELRGYGQRWACFEILLCMPDAVFITQAASFL